MVWHFQSSIRQSFIVSKSQRACVIVTMLYLSAVVITELLYRNRFHVLQIVTETPTVENSFMMMEGGKWMCRLCCAILGSQRSSKLHLNAVYLKERKHFCKFCNNAFTRSSSARAHERKCPQQVRWSDGFVLHPVGPEHFVIYIIRHVYLCAWFWLCCMILKVCVIQHNVCRLRFDQKYCEMSGSREYM